MNRQASWLQKKMHPSHQLAWIKERREGLDAVHHANDVARQHTYVKHLESMQKDPDQGSPIHEIFSASDEAFDPEFAARLITDNDLSLMDDLEQRPQSALIYQHLKLFLDIDGKTIKEYPVEYGEFFSQVRLKKLLQQVKPNAFILNERGKRVYKLAKELAKKEVEQWEAWRDMPNLYRLNEMQ